MVGRLVAVCVCVVGRLVAVRVCGEETSSCVCVCVWGGD